MKMRKLIFSVSLLILCFSIAGAQILKPVKWSFSSKKINAHEAEIILTATIDKGWHIYDQILPPGDGPIPTSFKFTPNSFILLGKTIDSHKATVEFDATFNKKIGFFSNSAEFRQRISFKSGKPLVKGNLTYMVCSSSQCLPPETIEFSVQIK